MNAGGACALVQWYYQGKEVMKLGACLVQIISLAWVWQKICRLPALFHWFQKRHDALVHVGLKAVHQFQPFLAKTMEHLQKCVDTEEHAVYQAKHLQTGMACTWPLMTVGPSPKGFSETRLV